MMTDPIADMLTRIRNAGKAKHLATECPASNLKLAIAKVLSDEGFISEVARNEGEGHPAMTITLRYRDDGSQIIEGECRGPSASAEQLGRELAQELLESGAGRLLETSAP